jgi:type VI secretion system protein ImpD
VSTRESPPAAAGGALPNVRPLRSCLNDWGINAAGLDFPGRLDTPQALIAWFGFDARADKQTLLARLNRDIAELDDQLSAMLNAILHHPRLQALEALWRSLAWLIATTNNDSSIRIAILDTDWPEIVGDLDRAGSVETSELFAKLYEQRFGIAGGEPVGLLVVDHPVRNGISAGCAADDVLALRNLAQIGAACFCPVVLGHAPELIGLETFDDHDIRRSVATAFDGPANARWRSFRQSSDARFIALAGPRIMMRAPYTGPEARDVGFCFAESCETHENFLWASAAFAVAHVVIRAHRDYRWAAAIRGTPADLISGGVIEGLPMIDYPAEAATACHRMPLDASCSESREVELNQLGLICVRPCYFAPYPALFNLQSVHQSADVPAHKIQPELQSALHYLLCVSRFAHYIKVMVRDWIGAQLTANDVQVRLQRWIDVYCNTNQSTSFEERARYPLRQARIQVDDDRRTPGHFRCTMQLRPHFQVEQVLSELRLQTQLADVGI